MSDWAPRQRREAELEKIQAAVAASPQNVEARFQRCRLLAELGKNEEAKTAYLELLVQEPAHFGALNNLGNLVYSMGYRNAAKSLYARAVELHPNNPKGHVNLANLLVETDPARATQHYEAALKIDPDHIEANRGMAYVLTRLRNENQAAIHRRKAFENRAVMEFPYTGAGQPIRVLLLASASGGIIPLRHHLDEQTFLTTVIFTEFFDPQKPLPPHDVVFNTIGDADLCREALEAASQIVENTTARVVNHPRNVLLTRRLESCRRLGQIEDVIAPKIQTASREQLHGEGAESWLACEGFSFPILVRAPGFHTGRFFERYDDAAQLRAGVAQMPGEKMMVIQFLDLRKPDGKIRKYRVMMIDGRLYPLHVAISHQWKIHYFTAEMAENEENRAEDAAFLDNMMAVLGKRALRALEEIRKTLGLQYAGVDFGIGPDGKIVLFEANATMVVNPPENDAKWDYRRQAVQRILDAVARLLDGRRD
jgi:hypothetical protein